MALMFHPWNGRSQFGVSQPSDGAQEALVQPNLTVTRHVVDAMVERASELQVSWNKSEHDIHLQVAREFGFENEEEGAAVLHNALKNPESGLRYRGSFEDNSPMC